MNYNFTFNYKFILSCNMQLKNLQCHFAWLFASYNHTFSCDRHFALKANFDLKGHFTIKIYHAMYTKSSLCHNSALSTRRDLSTKSAHCTENLLYTRKSKTICTESVLCTWPSIQHAFSIQSHFGLISSLRFFTFGFHSFTHSISDSITNSILISL